PVLEYVAELGIAGGKILRAQIHCAQRSAFCAQSSPATSALVEQKHLMTRLVQGVGCADAGKAGADHGDTKSTHGAEASCDWARLVWPVIIRSVAGRCTFGTAL